jgi:type I restriction enzyme M protein
MHFKTENSKTKPDKAPDELTIYIVGEDEFIYCPIRNRVYKVNNKPEEKVRQWWLYRLVEVYGYSFNQIDVEVKVTVGSAEAKKAADIVVYTDSKKSSARVFVEVKRPKRNDGIEQLKVYMNATGCRIGLWSNGEPPHVYLLRIEPKEGQEEATWRELRNIPKKTESLTDVDSPITRKDLEPVKDFLSIIKECENYVKAHEGVDAFDEIFKLIFAKLFDERANLKNDDSSAQFRVGILESPEDAKARVISLFKSASHRWSGVFLKGETLNLGDETLAFCVSTLQKVYLLKSDADVLGAAFEIMINPGMKGDKGQYFTPRHVVDMCIDILNPRDGETIFDPACGSGGFLVSAMSHVYRAIENERDDENEIIENKKDYAIECVYGMDYDPLIAKVAKAYMLIWGDGRSNIAVCDGLNNDNWDSETKSKFIVKADGKSELRKFDIIATNPPFAGDISSDDTLTKYHIAYKPQKNGGRKRVNKLSRDKLFIEQCINMLNPHGRLAIVLPRGIFKNYGDEYIRRYILTHCKILSVVGLGGDMFKPFTNTKTCIGFFQKREHPLDDFSEVEQDPKPVFALTESPGKDKTGNLIVDEEHNIISDLGEIADFVKANIQYTKAEH